MHRKRAWVAATFPLGLAVVMVLLISVFTQSPHAQAASPPSSNKALVDNRLNSASSVPGHLIAVQVSPDQRQVADPGTTILYDHVLVNRGSITDTVALSLQSSQGWPVSLVDASHPSGTPALTLEVGSLVSVSFQISLTIPPEVGTSSHRITVTATSQHDPSKQDTAVDLTMVSPLYVHLPLLVGVSHPLPGKPMLYSSAGNYTYEGMLYCVDWSHWPPSADTYELECAYNEAFTSLRWVFSMAGPGLCDYRPQPGVYYYRVRGHNEWGYGPYSNVVVVSVFPPSPPQMYPIENADGDGNYTVSWGTSEGSIGYSLEEDTVPDFAHPSEDHTGHRQSWSAVDKAPGTYYYRARGFGYFELGGWSNVVSVAVLTSDTLHLNRDEE